MKRRHLIELEDLAWWPRLLRDFTTDYLAVSLRVARTYSIMAPRLAAALERSGATQIIDLCSGGGGPWPDMLPALRAQGVDLPVCLTDKYPNVAAFTAAAQTIPGIRFEAGSVSVDHVPEHLTGFRTVFTAFHHFPPDDARAILAAAVRDRQGIAIFEAISRSPAGLATILLLVPGAVWFLTPLIRPFRWSRLFWTYVVPIMPFAVLFDGAVSCLRIYTVEEMRAMVQEVDSGKTFEWEIGSQCPAGSPIPIPYLIGIPRPATADSSFYPEGDASDYHDSEVGDILL